MPVPSTSRQPENPLCWFDSDRGQVVLAAEQGLMMPLLVSCAGSQSCLLLPTARAAASAMSTLMRAERRIWRHDEGWACSAQDTRGAGLPLPSRSVDLLLAMHVVATAPDALDCLAEITRVLAPGGTAFIVEFNPWSPYRRYWRGLGSISLWRLMKLARRAGLTVEETYGLCPEPPLGGPGILLRRDWRVLCCLPMRAHVLRLGACGVAPVAVGTASSFSFGVSGA